MIRTSETTAAILKAMVEAAPEITAIPKTKESKGFKFSYRYATLDGLIDMLRQVLPKHGLWFMQMPTNCDDSIELITRVFHTSGEWIEESIMFAKTEVQGGASDAQKIGASITYFRRYALASVFGVASDEDVDGQTGTPGTAKRDVQAPRAAASNAQAASSKKKYDATAYIMAVIARRMSEGETKDSILRGFAEMLKASTVRDVMDMDEAERTFLARELYARSIVKEA